ncbi:MAG: hypothetical protein CM15mP32_3740 [Flavobacteriaceae bacterium]|nr:MAG: hypothetical protein CM15mP32_3740 [Flavobacteriaceae bacterium]
MLRERTGHLYKRTRNHCIFWRQNSISSYEIDSLFDEDQQDGVARVFMEAENDDIQEA